ncbi:MAG TPA: hypothetical protein VHZ49_00920, partial [Methylomirabilota bacterium]|nr:hypothetical protein [Methylomirabilota bacterium]
MHVIERAQRSVEQRGGGQPLAPQLAREAGADVVGPRAQITLGHGFGSVSFTSKIDMDGISLMNPR